MNRRALKFNDQSRSDRPAALAGGVDLSSAPPASKVVRSLKAAVVGRKVLAGLDKGRHRAIAQAKERAAFHVAKVVIHSNADFASGKPERGRAGRIARKLGGMLSERQVKRILDRLSSVSDSA